MTKKTDGFKVKAAYLGGENKKNKMVLDRPLMAVLIASTVIISAVSFMVGSEYKRQDIQKQIWEATQSLDSQDAQVIPTEKPRSIFLSNIDFGTIPEIKVGLDVWKGAQSVGFRQNSEGGYSLYQTAMVVGGHGGAAAQRQISEVNYSFDEALVFGAKIETSAAKAKGLDNTSLFFDRAAETFSENHIVKIAKKYGKFKEIFAPKKTPIAPKI